MANVNMSHYIFDWCKIINFKFESLKFDLNATREFIYNCNKYNIA